MPPDILIPPSFEPVDLAYAKTFLRVDGDAENALITDLITAARMSVELLCGQAMIARRVSQTISRDCDRPLLKAMPVMAFHALYTADAAGVKTLVSSDDYSVNTRCTPPRLQLKPGFAWPEDAARLEAEYTAGFGDTPPDVPMPLRQAVLLMLAQSYEHRGDEANRPVPMMVDALLMPYRWMRL